MKTVTCSDIDGNMHEVEASDLSYRPSVYGIIIQDGKILLVPQFDGYDIPGGGIDVHETIEEALKREVKEETGLDVAMGRLVACEHSFFQLPNVLKNASCIMLFYLCDVQSGEITDEYFDTYEKKYARKARWVSLSEIDSLKHKSSVDTLKIIHRAIEMV